MKHFLMICIYGYAAYSLTHGHVDDGNTWGIYFQSGAFRLGDFWAALLTVACTIGAILESREIW
jgi:hypothetical protein